MKRRNKIIYSISVGDIQGVAVNELNRLLTEKEFKLVEKKLDDLLEWHEVIVTAIEQIVDEQNGDDELGNE